MSVALINEVLRDFERYTGDGKPNAPVGHPLPIGDPRSGIYNPGKYQLRQLLLSILQAQGDPDALQDILDQLNDKADKGVLLDLARAAGLIFLGTATNTGGTPVNLTLTMPPSLVEVGLTSFPAGSLAAFVASGETPEAGGDIQVTVEGLPSPDVAPLLSPNGTRILGGLIAGRTYIMRRHGGQWRQVTDAVTHADIENSIAGIRQLLGESIHNAGVFVFAPVANDGAGNLSADWPQWAVDLGINHLNGDMTAFVQVPGDFNPGPATFALSSSEAQPVHNADDTPLVGGEIGGNRTYLFKWYPGPQRWRVLVGIEDARIAEVVRGLPNYGVVTIAPTSAIDENGVITAAWPDWLVSLGGDQVVAGSVFCVQIPGNYNTGPDISIMFGDKGPFPIVDLNGVRFDRDSIGMNHTYLLKYYPSGGGQFRVVAGANPNRNIQQSDLLSDGSARLMTAREYQSQDIMRLTKAGVQMRLDPFTGDEALAKGMVELGPLLMDGGRDVLSYGRGGTYQGAIIRLYPDRVEIPGLAIPTDGVEQRATIYGPFAADLFKEVGGLMMPSLIDGDGNPRGSEGHSTMGQSNGDQASTAEMPFWSRSPWFRHTYMPNDATSNGGRGGMRGWGGVEAPGFTDIVPADSSVTQNEQFYGDASIQALNYLRPGPKPVSIYRASALGGAFFVHNNLSIWKTGDPATADPTTLPDAIPFLNWKQDIRNMYDAAAARGFPMQRLYINFTHQEANWTMPRETYLAQINMFKAEIEAYIATIDPLLEVLWFVDQASGSGLRSDKFHGNAWPNRMAIVDFANQHNNVTMVMPRYWMKFGYLVNGTLEDIHHDKRSKIWQGELYGHAKNEIIAGRAWKCPWATDAVIDGNDVVITFDTLEPLQLDWTFCKVRPDAGFQLFDPNSDISYGMASFADNAEWDLAAGTATYVGSVSTVSNNQGENLRPVVQNKTYRVSADIQRLDGTTGRVRVQIRWLSSENPDTVISVKSGEYITLSDTSVRGFVNEAMPPAGAQFFDLMLTVDGANTDGQVRFSNIILEATPTPASKVEVVSHDQVRCTFDTSPAAGARIRYAYRTQDEQDVADVWPIGTGALRDGWEAMSLLDPGKKFIRAALGFELEL